MDAYCLLIINWLSISSKIKKSHNIFKMCFCRKSVDQVTIFQQSCALKIYCLLSLHDKSVSASARRVKACVWPNSAALMAGLRPFKSTMFGLAPRSSRKDIIFSLFLHAARWSPVSPFSGSTFQTKASTTTKKLFYHKVKKIDPPKQR